MVLLRFTELKNISFTVQIPIRIMGSQNWWFGDPKEPLIYGVNPPPFLLIP